METIQLFLNERLVSISANAPLINQMRNDDNFLSDYIVKAVKSGQFTFLTEADLKTLTVKRAVVTRIVPKSQQKLKQIWYRKGKPTDEDNQATSLLLQLRSSDKYTHRFDDKKTARNQLWDEIAGELRSAGFDADSTRCQQKFLNMTKAYVRYFRKMQNGTTDTELKIPEFFLQLDLLLREKVERALNQEKMYEATHTPSNNNSSADAAFAGGEVYNSGDEDQLGQVQADGGGGESSTAGAGEDEDEDQQQEQICRPPPLKKIKLPFHPTSIDLTDEHLTEEQLTEVLTGAAAGSVTLEGRKSHSDQSGQQAVSSSSQVRGSRTAIVRNDGRSPTTDQDGAQMQKIVRIMEERTALMKQRNEQRERMLELFEKLVNKLG